MKAQPVDRRYIACLILMIRKDQPFNALSERWTIGEWNRHVRKTAYNAERSVARFKQLNLAN